MNAAEAKQVLLLYRPGSPDDREPEVGEALELARRDEELQCWWEQHCAFQAALRTKFRQIEVPADLKAKILARQKVVSMPVWWRRPTWLAAAAALVFFLGLTAFWLGPRTPDRFADYQSRMVRTVLRQYRMDLVTNDMTQVRQFLAAGGAPADYVVPKGLQRLSLTGTGLLRWRSHPVSMVCFDRGTNQMMFLFVTKRSALKDPPAAAPSVVKVNKLLAASWSEGDKAYVLAGPEEPDFVRKYL